MISKSTVDLVFETARLEEVIGDFVQLKKSGSNFKGLSPFSNEKTPSFMVSPAKQIWKDFSSGKGGNVVSFLMEHEHFTFPEAIKFLAKKYNIEVEETQQTSEQKEAASLRESMYAVTDFAQSFFSKMLTESQEGKNIGLAYFQERGFTAESIDRFHLGYSPDQWDAFTKAALDAGFQEEFLVSSGLTIQKVEKQFDRFKGRVMFPIHSMSGRVMGFGGRILKQDKQAAKYVNSPESEVYQKSKVLYGLYQAKQHIAKQSNCYLVEGYTDVIQMHQAGIQNVVSSSGTALTPDQVRLIRRLTDTITLLFDGDAAGLRAAMRGVDIILEAGMQVSICTFPDGEDPDSFVRNHQLTEVKQFLKNNTVDFIQFKAKLLAEEGKNEPIRKAETIREIVQSISIIPDAIRREVYIQSCASLMNISEDVLFSTLAQLLQKKGLQAPQDRKLSEMQVVNVPKQKVDPRFELERNIISLLLLYGQEEVSFEDVVMQSDEEGKIVLTPTEISAKVYEKIYLDLQQDEVELSTQSFRELYHSLLSIYNAQKPLVMETFLQELTPEQSELVSSIIMNDENNVLHDWERKNIVIKDKKTEIGRWLQQTILNLRCLLIQEKIGELQNQTAESHIETHREILEEVNDYVGLKKNLSNRLDRVIF
ncbi:MAG: DNA primase [Flavobacteriaceae bacterium]|nr:MAG: DNA primase [Flavobacteriaceae bacterium TMED81]